MIVTKTTIRISVNEIMSIDDSDIYHCYFDLWKGPSERFVMAYQSIGKDKMVRRRIGTADATSNKESKAIATAFVKRFCILLDFELLESLDCELLEAHMLFYQAGLGDRLEYEQTFNNYNKVSKSTDEAS